MTQSEIDFFDNLAPNWDAMEERSTPSRVRSILNKIPFKEGMNVLDLGTGTGILIPYISELVGKNGRITAIDLSEGMLSRAIKKYGELKNVEFLKLDFEEELIPGMYDVVMLYSVYPHLSYPEETLKWLFKFNINPDGYVVIAFPSDEKFINNIHHERHSESGHLPPANILARNISSWGFQARVISYSSEEYVIIIRNIQ